MIYCKDCTYFMSWGRPPEVVAKYGQAYDCSIGILNCPEPGDFCSKAELIKKCNKCGAIFDVFPKFCPNCGAKMIEPQESEEYEAY